MPCNGHRGKEALKRITGTPRVRPAGQGARVPEPNMPNSMEIRGQIHGQRTLKGTIRRIK